MVQKHYGNPTYSLIKKVINKLCNYTFIEINEENAKTSVKDETLLRFEPLSSCLDPNFWFKVCQLKLEVDKLDEVHRPLVGYYTSNNNPYISLDCSSFNQYVIIFFIL